MTRRQQQERPATRSMVRLLAVALVLLHTASATSVPSVNTDTELLSPNSESEFRFKFLQKPAAADKGELYLRHRDNEEDNNAPGGLRYRREDAPGGSKVVTTNWGTYEEQVPVVIASASSAIDPATDDDEETFSDEMQSRESTDEYGSPAGVGSISYEEYEDGRFEEGRQFYPSRSGGYSAAEQEQEQPDGYYRQKYYATTPRNDNLNQGEQSKEDAAPAQRPHYPYRYRAPVQQKKDEDESQGIMGFVQKAKTFYDIFRAMNSAWKAIEERYHKNGQGIFLGEESQINETFSSTETPVTTEKTTKSPRLKNKKRKTTTTSSTTKAPEIPIDEEDEVASEEQQAKDEYRSRRSSATTNSPDVESSSDSELESESDADSSESESVSTPSTAVAEGRYIKGDPLKGYYDFVITEGSYKFWAAFQVGTAILIIYSTFAAIYYSKVNPLVSDYDYIDYLGGGRSLSDDSDFVDDTPAAVAASTDAIDDVDSDSDGSKKAAASGKGAAPEGTPRNQRRQTSAAGWFDWLPHAGHTLRFILEAIDKGYTEE